MIWSSLIQKENNWLCRSILADILRLLKRKIRESWWDRILLGSIYYAKRLLEGTSIIDPYNPSRTRLKPVEAFINAHSSGTCRFSRSMISSKMSLNLQWLHVNPSCSRWKDGYEQVSAEMKNIGGGTVFELEILTKFDTEKGARQCLDAIAMLKLLNQNGFQ